MASVSFCLVDLISTNRTTGGDPAGGSACVPGWVGAGAAGCAPGTGATGGSCWADPTPPSAVIATRPAATRTDKTLDIEKGTVTLSARYGGRVRVPRIATNELPRF